MGVDVGGFNMSEALALNRNEIRRKYIGGTDAAGVLGLSRWKTPISVWAEKTGAIVDEDETNLHKEVGTLLEDDVAELFMRRTGKKVRRANETIFHKKHPFLGANVDRMIVGEDAGLECKTAAVWKSKEWDGDEIPREYVLQCLHYLAVTGKKRWYLAVLIGNQDFKWKVIERDENLLNDMVKREVSFWNDYVLPNVMPSVVTKYDGDTLDKLFPQAKPEKEIELNDDASQLIEIIESYKADKKNLEAMIEKSENELKLMLSDATVGLTSQYRVNWSNSQTKRFDSKSLLAEMPEIHEKFCKVTPMRRFSIKRINLGE